MWECLKLVMFFSHEKNIRKKSLSNFTGNLSGREESGESLTLFIESFSHDIYLNSFSNSFERENPYDCLTLN